MSEPYTLEEDERLHSPGCRCHRCEDIRTCGRCACGEPATAHEGLCFGCADAADARDAEPKEDEE